MENKNKQIDYLTSPLFISKVPPNEAYFSLDKSIDWIGELLNELNETSSQLPTSELFKRTKLDIDITTKKHHSTDSGEFVTMDIKVDTEYFTDCVRTLTMMKDSLAIEFKICFVSEEHSKNTMYLDQIEVFKDNQLWELHFYQKRQLDLKEAIHEQIYLNKNNYPVRENSSPAQEDSPAQ
jgi:uncharacterized metal-binding protein YceD (DUF177 family)